MAQQTINIGASPNDGTGTPLRTAFQYTNSNFSELYTAVGPSGNNIVVPGNATISGDLTVDTSTLKVDSTNNRVGVGTASPAVALDVVGAATVTGALTGQSSASFYTGTALPLHIRNSGTSFTQIGDNGTIGAGTAFIVGSSDASLRFQCGGAEQMRLNATGLGVGIASPSYRLEVRDTADAVIALVKTGANSLRFLSTSSGGVINQVDNNPLAFYTNNTERARIDSSGNFGLGVTPSAWGAGTSVIDMNSAGNAAALSSSGTLSIANNGFFNGTDWKYKNTSTALLYQLISGTHRWFTAASGTAGTTITDFATAKMTLDASGNLLVGTTTAGAKITALAGASGQAAIFQQPAQNFWCVLAHNQATSGDNSFVLFGTEASFTSRGSITYNRAAGQVSYNITSDYRLKEDVKPLTGALNRISSLKPSTYKFKETGFTCEGFIAHELAEVIPAAVTGEKDAVNEDGSIKAQGVDLSKVVPILVAAIQELTARVQTLETR